MALVYPSGRRVQYNYGSPAQLYPKSVQVIGATPETIVSNANYDSLGHLASYSSGVVGYSGSWDLAGQQLERSYDVGMGRDFIWTLTTRDGVGNIKVIDEQGAGAAMSIDYDGQYRVTSAIGTRWRGNQACELTYDLAGNRVTETTGTKEADVCSGRTITYDYASASNSMVEMSWPGGATCGGTTVVRDAMTPDICVDDELKIGRSTGAWMPWNNCNTFTGCVFKKCKNKCQSK